MVVLLMLIPLLAPSESGAPTGLKTIARALGIAALKVSTEESNVLSWQITPWEKPTCVGGPHLHELLILMLPWAWCLRCWPGNRMLLWQS